MNSCFITSFLLSLALVCLCTALIHPVDPFNANEDAKNLRQAITDSNQEAITNLLTRRSGEQRVAIAQAYNTAFNRNLVKDFISELSGDYEDLMVAMVTPLPEYYAKELYTDAQVFIPDSKAALDIVATASYAELKAIDEAFNRLKLHHYFGVSGILSVVFQGISAPMLAGVFKGKRNESQEVNAEAAIADAKFIHDIGEGKNGFLRTYAEEDKVEEIFITHSYRQLRQIFVEYEKLYGHGIEKAFKDRGFYETIEKGILNMIPIIKSKTNYFATRLYDTMHGPGTNDRSLIRLIVSRSEKDLDKIKEAFQRINGCSLTSIIEDDTSGEYRRALLAIVNS